MPSLSSYDRGKKAMEGRRYVADIESGNAGFAVLNSQLPRTVTKHFLHGNHEHRITRACEADAQLDGLLSLDHLETPGWNVHGFLEPVELDGICYSHYFAHPMTGRPYGGSNLETRLKTIGHSFTMGHQQGRKFAQVDTIRGSHLGLCVGSCYLHEEDYLGPQNVNYWRGIVVKHEVDGKGGYDPMFVSLDYLCRRFEGRTLTQFRNRKRPA